MSTELCRLDEIPEDNGLAVDYVGPRGRRRVILFRTAGGLRGFLDVCPHQGRSLEFAPGEYLLDERDILVCPHHGASFELSGGACLSGPCAGDHLTRVEVVLKGERVLLRE